LAGNPAGGVDRRGQETSGDKIMLKDSIHQDATADGIYIVCPCLLCLLLWDSLDQYNKTIFMRGKKMMRTDAVTGYVIFFRKAMRA